MNTLFFIYALEVQKTGSITQAARNLFMSQPTLSKAIKELESSLGFSVFRRSSKGVVPTQKGQEFLVHARKIVVQIQRMEQSLQAQDASHQLFSLAIPRVNYIAQAAAEYVCSFDGQRKLEIDIQETSSVKVIDSVAYGHFVLGIIRYHAEDEDYFLKNLAEKGLQHEMLWRSNYVALMRSDHPLAQRRPLAAEDFQAYIEIAFGDEEVPYIRVSQSEGIPDVPVNSKRILVYDRAMQFDILRNNPLAYTWASPSLQEILLSNNLVQCRCRQSCEFIDLLISRNGYRFSKLDRDFIDKLYLQKNKVAYGD